MTTLARNRYTGETPGGIQKVSTNSSIKLQPIKAHLTADNTAASSKYIQSTKSQSKLPQMKSDNYPNRNIGSDVNLSPKRQR